MTTDIADALVLIAALIVTWAIGAGLQTRAERKAQKNLPKHQPILLAYRIKQFIERHTASFRKQYRLQTAVK